MARNCERSGSYEGKKLWKLHELQGQETIKALKALNARNYESFQSFKGKKLWSFDSFEGARNCESFGSFEGKKLWSFISSEIKKQWNSEEIGHWKKSLECRKGMATKRNVLKYIFTIVLSWFYMWIVKPRDGNLLEE